MYYFFPWKEPELGDRQITVLSCFTYEAIPIWSGDSLLQYLVEWELDDDEYFQTGRPSAKARKYLRESLQSLQSRGLLKLINEEEELYELTAAGILERARLRVMDHQRATIRDTSLAADYPKNWDQISQEIKHREGWRCGFCDIEHGSTETKSGKPVVLTTAHLQQPKTDCRPENLRALCQACHLGYDLDRHVSNRKRNKRGKYVPGSGYEGVGKLF